MASRIQARVCVASLALALGACIDLPKFEPKLTGIEVTAPAPSLPAGVNRQLAATGKYSDGTARDVSPAVRWTSADPGVAVVSETGILTSVAPGSTTISATDSATAITGTVTLTVTTARLVSIAVTPAAPSVPLGASAQFTATGTYGDGTTQDLTGTVVWSSSVSAVAAFGEDPGTRGLASTGTAGTSAIIATHPSSGVSGSTTLTVTAAQLVSVAVTPPAPSVVVGVTKQLAATGTYTNGTTEDLTASVVWTSSDEGVASVSDAGVARGTATGTATIQASDPATHVSGSATLTVTAPQLASIAVTPAAPSVPLGLTRQLTATGTYTDGTTQDLTDVVTWSSSNAAVASVSNAAGARGLASSAATGTTTVQATDPGSQTSGSTLLTVTAAQLASIAVAPADPSVPLGLDRQLTATGAYTDGSTQDLTAVVTWSSSDPAIASVSNAAGSSGLASSAAIGATTIRAAEAATGIAGSTTLTVSPARLVSIEVTPAAGTVAPGETQQLTATGTYSDGTAQDLTAVVTWSSSDAAVVQVSNASGSNGLATGLAAGAITVEARDPQSGILAIAALTVAAP